jgi:anion-transporting  ArsA/GET3 family ATPase
MTPDRLLIEKHRVLICLGPGGVGKTTISAALAVHAATIGRVVDVMTVDPAPRLLDALGLEADASEPHQVPLDALRVRRRGHLKLGRLRALRLDPKRTFDAIVARYAPSAAARDALLANGIYRNLSSALAGVGDYMAMERLLELAGDEATQNVVLDTPPAAEAIDFLDAPRRLLELLSSRAVSLLGAPGGLLRSRLRLVDLAARAVLSAFDRLTGLNLLADVQAFVQGFDGMYAGFAERAERARDLIRSGDTAIVVVTTGEAGRIAQARDFIAALDAAGLKIIAVVVNRVMAEVPDASAIDAAKIPAALKRKLRRNLADYTALKRREESSLSALKDCLPAKARLIVAHDLGHEPRTIADLAAIGKGLLFG